jgi:hypothetical protein
MNMKIISFLAGFLFLTVVAFAEPNSASADARPPMHRYHHNHHYHGYRNYRNYHHRNYRRRSHYRHHHHHHGRAAHHSSGHGVPKTA